MTTPKTANGDDGGAWLSIQEAADYLGVATKTIRRRITDGSLLASRFGPRMIRIQRYELDRLMQPMPPGQ